MVISRKRKLIFSSRQALWLVIIMLIMTAVAGGCSPQSSRVSALRPGENAPAPQVGRSAIDFSLVDLDGNQFSLSDFRGKTVFINFWATWCPPCRAEMPDIEEIYQKYKEDVMVIGVDVVEPEELVRTYVEKGNFSWLFGIDTTGELSRNYRVAALPESFFIDANGIIQAITIGALNFDTMEAKLALAMN